MKSKFWQSVRGGCILAVIMIHCPTGQFGMYQAVWLAVRQTINFPVAVFVFMAGYFVKPEKVNLHYLKVRMGRLIIPFLLWSTLYTIKNALFGNVRAWDQVLFNFVTGRSAAPLYYILVLIQFTFLTPLLIKMKNRKWLYTITPTYLCGLYIWNFVVGITPSLYGTFFPAWMSFYIFGMDARAGKMDIVVKRANPLWVVMMLTVAWMESFALQQAGCSIGFVSSQIKFSTFIYAYLIILVLLKNQGKEGKGVIRGVLSKVGDCSYGMFFSHMMVMYVVSKMFRILGLQSGWCAEWLWDFVLTALGSYFFVDYVRKTIEKRYFLKLMGFD